MLNKKAGSKNYSKAKQFGKSRKEWESWGKEFGEQMGKRGREFGEEVEDIGERIRENFNDYKREKKNRNSESVHCFYWPLGIIWPLFGSIIGIVFLLTGIFFLDWLNFHFQSAFLSTISNFLFNNSPLFFGLSLFFGYAGFLSKVFPRAYWIIAPIVNSVGIVFIAWIAAWMLKFINLSVKSGFLSAISSLLLNSLFEIFVVFAVLGYALAVIRKLLGWECD